VVRRLLQLLLRRHHPDQWESRGLGRAGERAAARHLKRQGYRILGRNVQVAIGEADLLCMAPDRRTIVLVEVKTRLRGSGRSLKGEIVAPEASVHARKRRKLRAVLGTLSRANGWLDRPKRIDVIAVEWPAGGGKPLLRHHEGILT
jgi:putative endonuclease